MCFCSVCLLHKCFSFFLWSLPIITAAQHRRKWAKAVTLVSMAVLGSTRLTRSVCLKLERMIDALTGAPQCNSATNLHLHKTQYGPPTSRSYNVITNALCNCPSAFPTGAFYPHLVLHIAVILKPREMEEKVQTKKIVLSCFLQTALYICQMQKKITPVGHHHHPFSFSFFFFLLRLLWQNFFLLTFHVDPHCRLANRGWYL